MKTEKEIKERLATIELIKDQPEINKEKAEQSIKELKWVLE